MSRKKDGFFDATQDALDKITQLYDLVWPIDVSLRHMRKIVTEFVNESEEKLKPEDFEDYFDPQHRTHGVNYERAFVYSGETALEQEENEALLESAQQESLAWMLLCNTIPIYENWWKRLMEETGMFGISEAGMEFPTNPLDPRKKGIKTQLAELTQTESKVLKDVFYELYSSKKNHCKDLDELNRCMYAYRLFKEIRNCYMHSGGVVSNKVVDSKTGKPWITVAYEEYQNNVATYSIAGNPLGIQELPQLPSYFNPSLGNNLHITLRGVVGFSNVLRRIILTIDAELICSEESERYLLEKWKTSAVGTPRKCEMKINEVIINYLVKTFNGENICAEEIERVKKYFNKGTKFINATHEYNSMIHFLNTANLLTPRDAFPNKDDENAAETRYKEKLVKVLIPYLKDNSLIDLPLAEVE